MEALSPGHPSIQCTGFLIHSSNCASVHASIHIMKQIWMIHCTYELHSHYARWAYRPNICAQIHQNTTNCYFTLYCQIYARNVPLKCYIDATDAKYFMCTYKTTMSVYITHMNLLHSIMWSKALYTYISHYWHMPWINRPATIHMHVPPHFQMEVQTPHYCTYQSKINKLQLYYCKIGASNKIYPSNAIYIPYAKITWGALMGELCKHICHIWTCLP